MRKLYTVILTLLGVLLVACSNPAGDGTSGDGSYTYSYKENKDGSVLLRVEGSWQEDQAWSFVNFDETNFFIEELSQTKTKAEFQVIPKEAPLSYQAIEFMLSDVDTGENISTIILSIEYDVQKKAFQVDDVDQLTLENGMDVEHIETEDMEDAIILSSEEIALLEQEAAQEAAQQQAQSQQELEEAQKAKEFVWSHIPQVTFPEDILVFSGEKPTGLPGDLEAVSFRFEYKGERYSCLVSDATPLSQFQAAFEIDSEKAMEKEVNGIVTYQFLEEKSARYLMWKDNAGVLYFIMDENQENVLDEIAALFLR